MWTHSREEVTYTHWAKGAATNHNDHSDCVQMTKDDDFKWRDTDCVFTKAAPICERDIEREEELEGENEDSSEEEDDEDEHEGSSEEEDDEDEHKGSSEEEDDEDEHEGSSEEEDDKDEHEGSSEEEDEEDEHTKKGEEKDHKAGDSLDFNDYNSKYSKAKC